MKDDDDCEYYDEEDDGEEHKADYGGKERRVEDIEIELDLGVDEDPNPRPKKQVSFREELVEKIEKVQEDEPVTCVQMYMNGFRYYHRVFRIIYSCNLESSRAATAVNTFT